jgi:Zn-dependent peptidase ImmA (M78 family)
VISNVNRAHLAREALTASSKLRKRYGYDLSSPLNIIDLCETAGVPVRFVDINMEGMYVQLGEGVKSTIFISALRPFHRKIYTCAHEFGHHYFGHGFSVDQITNSPSGYSAEEFLVDTLASYLLLPPIGLNAAFLKRKIQFEKATAIDCFTIASCFGVGYSTMINHLSFNAQIGKTKATQLLRQPLKAIKASIAGEDLGATLFVFDGHTANRTIDMETTGYILFPTDVELEETTNLLFYKHVSLGNLYKAVQPGLTRVFSTSNDWSCFVRIQQFQYVGLGKFRHLSN